PIRRATGNHAGRNRRGAARGGGDDAADLADPIAGQLPGHGDGEPVEPRELSALRPIDIQVVLAHAALDSGNKSRNDSVSYRQPPCHIPTVSPRDLFPGSSSS